MIDSEIAQLINSYTENGNFDTFVGKYWLKNNVSVGLNSGKTFK